MHISRILLTIFSLIIVAPSSEIVAAQPPAISVENVHQLTLRQTLNEKGKWYYVHHIHPAGEAILVEVTNTSDFSSALIVFDTFTGEKQLELKREQLSDPWDDNKFIVSVIYSPTGDSILVALASYDDQSFGEIAVFDATSGEERQRFVVPALHTGGAVYALDGDVLIVSTFGAELDDESLLVLDHATGEMLGSLLLRAPANWLAANGNTLVHGSFLGGSVVTFDRTETGVSFGNPIFYAGFSPGKPRFGDFAFPPDGSMFTMYHETRREVLLFSATDGTLQTTIPIPGAADHRVFDAYSDGELVVVGEENMVRIFDVDGNLLVEREHFDLAGSCVMDPQRITLVCWSERGVSIWGIE